MYGISVLSLRSFFLGDLDFAPPSSSLSEEEEEGEEVVGSTHPSHTCSKSCVTKSLLLSRRYTSLALRHSILFVAFIHVASLGADQFIFGNTEPPSSCMVEVTWAWSSGHAAEGSEEVSSESESEALEEEEEGGGVRGSGRETGRDRGEGGRIMPSERR